MEDYNERISIVPYDPEWQTLFEQESRLLQSLFSADRLRAIEHYGSTAVQNLAAKPIIGILCGFSLIPLFPTEEQILEKIGYSFDRKVHDAYYWKKRTNNQFTLAIVQYLSNDWHDHLLIRDYLRKHPEQVTIYAAVKYQAIADGFDTPVRYRQAKKEYLEQLFADAKQWKQQE
jgi:GrpB-like predicted nucleotidyltransferase (UPF0157 family)